MKPLKLKWHRTLPEDQDIIAIYGELKSFYTTKGKVLINGTLVDYLAVVVQPILKPRRYDYHTTVIVGPYKLRNHHGALRLAQETAVEDIENLIELLEKEAPERESLIRNIQAIYEFQGRKVKDLDSQTTENLRRQFGHLKDMNFPWEIEEIINNLESALDSAACEADEKLADRWHKPMNNLLDSFRKRLSIFKWSIRQAKALSAVGLEDSELII